MKTEIPLSELKENYRWIKSTLEKSAPDYNGDFNYEIPFASFSDYSGSMVERANSRALESAYDFVTLDTAGMGTVYTVIRDQDIWSAISDEKFSDFRAEVDSLSDYPLLDESLYSEMTMQAENEAWEDWIAAYFRREIEKTHRDAWEENADSEDLSDALEAIEDKDLARLFLDLCEKTGRYPEIETGGGVWIDLEKLSDSLPFKTLLEVISGAYFINPDAVQISLKF